MRSKIVSAETMEIGKKGGGKHWTDAEVSARKKAKESIKRKKIKLTAPEWLTKNERAMLIWDRLIRDSAEIELLDNLDSDMLAAYCDAVDKYQTLSQTAGEPEEIKLLQGWSRIISGHAEKLGFTPSARARLVKKIADSDIVDQFGDEFDK